MSQGYIVYSCHRATECIYVTGLQSVFMSQGYIVYLCHRATECIYVTGLHSVLYVYVTGLENTNIHVQYLNVTAIGCIVT